MVSTEKGREHKFQKDKITTRDFFDYYKNNKDVLRDPSNFMGGWVEDDTLYLDVSRNVTDRTEAINLAKKHNQEGIYDVQTGQTISKKDYDK